MAYMDRLPFGGCDRLRGRRDLRGQRMRRRRRVRNAAGRRGARRDHGRSREPAGYRLRSGAAPSRNVRGRQALSIYGVKRDASGAVNCADKVRSGAFLLRQGASNELDLEVLYDEAICLANAAGDAAPDDADVSWHARRGANAPTGTPHAIHPGRD